jgi:hypothetical protein
MAWTGRIGVLSAYRFIGYGAGIRPCRFRSRGPRVSIDEQHVALPKLYGAPAYARPPKPVELAPRPFDPDQLPLQVNQTDGERRYADHIPAHAHATVGEQGDPGATGGESRAGMRPRSFSLREIAGRLLGSD